MAHWHIGHVHGPKLCLTFLFRSAVFGTINADFFWWECEKGIFLYFFWVIRGSLAYDFIFLFVFFPDLIHVLVSTISHASHQLLMFLPCFDFFFPLQLLLAVKCSRILQIHFICVFVFICNASPAAATPRSSQSAIASSMGKQNWEGIQAQSSWGN